MEKNKCYTAVFVLIFLLLVLMFNTRAFASNSDITITMDNNLQLNQTVNSAVTFQNISPGDEVDYIMHIKNQTSENINLYFLEAIDNVNTRSQKLNKITFKIYINNMLYAEGNALSLINKYIYTVNSHDEMDILIKIGLDESAGNEYQNFKFNISWKIGAQIKIDEDENVVDNKTIDNSINDGKIDANISNNIDAILDTSNSPKMVEITIIPKTGESRYIYYILFISIAIVLIYIAIILLKSEKKDSDNDIDNN